MNPVFYIYTKYFIVPYILSSKQVPYTILGTIKYIVALFFDDLSFCQNVRFRPLCLPYSSVVPALMDFIRFSRGWVLPFCQGGGGFCFPFAVCGVRVCAGGPPACQVTGLLGALWLFKMCPVFLSDKSGMRF